MLQFAVLFPLVAQIGIFLQIAGQHLVRILAHGAELEHVEGLAVLAQTTLPVEHRPATVQTDQQAQQQAGHRTQHDHGQTEHEVQGSLEALPPATAQILHEHEARHGPQVAGMEPVLPDAAALGGHHQDLDEIAAGFMDEAGRMGIGRLQHQGDGPGMATLRVLQLASGFFHVRGQREDVYRRKAQPGVAFEIMPQLTARIAAIKDHQRGPPPAELAKIVTAEAPCHRQKEDAQQPGPHEHDTRIGHTGLAREQQGKDEAEGQCAQRAEFAAFHIGRQRDDPVKAQGQPHERRQQEHGKHPVITGDVKIAPQGAQAQNKKRTGKKRQEVATHQQDDAGRHPQTLQHALS